MIYHTEILTIVQDMKDIKYCIILNSGVAWCDRFDLRLCGVTWSGVTWRGVV